MEERNDNTALLILGVPRGVSLLEIGYYVEERIGKFNSLTGIKWLNPNSESDAYNVKVKLSCEEGEMM